MTNTLTYSTATGTAFAFPPASGQLRLGLLDKVSQHVYTPRVLSDRTLQFIENIAYMVRQAQESAADNSALLIVGGIVTGMITMATAIGVSLSL